MLIYGATVAHTGNRNVVCLFCLLLGFYSMCVMALIENHFNGLGHSLGFSFFCFVNCSS